MYSPLGTDKSRKMKILQSGEILIAKETDYTSGSIGLFGWGVNDAYDIYLAEDLSKNLILILFMKIQFIFDDSSSAPWTSLEKRIFVRRFESTINRKWGNKRLLKTISKGKNVYIDFRFESIIEGWSTTEHWEVHVKKIKKGAFSTSSVNPFTGRVNLDSEDFSTIPKKGGGRQRGIVHEFGHMLGLPDEYKLGTTHAKDFHSIMNGGELIRGRHDSVYIKWLDEVLTQKGIK